MKIKGGKQETKTDHCNSLRQAINLLEGLGATHQANSLRDSLIGCESESTRDMTAETTSHVPNPFIRSINFAAAMVRHSRNRFQHRTREEIDERLAICQACPQFADDHCRVCGCPCVEANQLLNKLALASETCPLGKWT